jgi:hut operon positive regulator
MAIRLALADSEPQPAAIKEAQEQGYRVVVGRVGSMAAEKIVAAIETAVAREGLLKDIYRHEHSLYHAVIEAIYGVCRGQLELGNLLRTVGLNFAVVRGLRSAEATTDGEWLAVALYGTIGAPKKGFEHEVCGLGVNHL